MAIGVSEHQSINHCFYAKVLTVIVSLPSFCLGEFHFVGKIVSHQLVDVSPPATGLAVWHHVLHCRPVIEERLFSSSWCPRITNKVKVWSSFRNDIFARMNQTPNVTTNRAAQHQLAWLSMLARSSWSRDINFTLPFYYVLLLAYLYLILTWLTWTLLQTEFFQEKQVFPILIVIIFSDTEEKSPWKSLTALVGTLLCFPLLSYDSK